MAAPRQSRQSTNVTDTTITNESTNESNDSNDLNNENLYDISGENLEGGEPQPTIDQTDTTLAEPIKTANFGIQFANPSTIDFQHVFPRTTVTILDVKTNWIMPKISTVEPKDFDKETKRIISGLTTDLETTFQEKIRDPELIPFSIFILIRTFIHTGTAVFHSTADEEYRDTLLYRGIYSVLKMMCTEQQLKKILPECYSIMFSTEISNLLTQKATSFTGLKKYMDSLPFVTSSPLYKVLLFKQLTQLPTWASKYQGTNLVNIIMEYHLRLVELSRQTSISLSSTWLLALDRNWPEKTSKIFDYLDSRNASTDASYIEIDELLSTFQYSRTVSLSTDNQSFHRRAELKVLLTEVFECSSYVWKNITNERSPPESNPQIAAYKPDQRRQANTTTTSKSHCPHRDNHSNCSVKQLNPQDWAKSYNLLYYITRLIIILVKKCSIDQAEATLDNLMTKLHFGHGKSFAYEIAGINNSTLKKNIERCGVYERGRNLTGPDDLIPGLPWTHLYSSNAKPWRGKSQITTDSKRIKKHYYTLELAPKDMIEPDLQDAELNLTTLETHEAKDSWYILDSN